MEYIIAEGKNTKDLTEKVNKLMEEGYFPVGGITITEIRVGSDTVWLLVQPMVKLLKEFEEE